MEILFLLSGLVVGVLLSWAYHRRLVKMSDEAHARELSLLSQQQAQILADRDNLHKEAMTALQARFDLTASHLSEQLKTATEEMLKSRQQEFAQSSTAQLGQLVTPLRETMNQMRQTMENNVSVQNQLSGEMRNHMQNMMLQTQQARESAQELARVFKHRSKVQGDWGERVLEELLMAHGMTRGVHFETQATLRDQKGNTLHNEDGRIMRPDVILHVDENRELIIDSKVSLTAFMDYVNAEDEAAKEAALKAHVDSLQKHVKELSTKDYSAYIQKPKVSLDYVIMFVPHTGALWTALNEKPDLWRRAMEQNVFIADEQTLYAALRIVQLTWTQIKQREQHEQVYKLADEMLDRVGQFMKRYDAIGKALDSARSAYDDAQKKLDPQGQSILGTARKLTQLGAKISQKNPLPQLEVEG